MAIWKPTPTFTLPKKKAPVKKPQVGPTKEAAKKLPPKNATKLPSSGPGLTYSRGGGLSYGGGGGWASARQQSRERQAAAKRDVTTAPKPAEVKAEPKADPSKKWYYNPRLRVTTTTKIEGQEAMTKQEALNVVRRMPRKTKVEYGEAYRGYTQAKRDVQRAELSALAGPMPKAPAEFPSLAEGIRAGQPKPFPERAMITAAPKISPWKETPKYLKEKAAKFEFKALKTHGIKGQLYQAGAFGLGVAAGFTYPVRHPVSFAKGVYTLGKGLVTKPFETGAAIKQELVYKPSSFLGEIVGTAAFGKVAPKVAKPVVAKLPKPKVTTFKVPTKTGAETLYKGLAVEYGARGKPLVGISKGKIKFGTPAVDLTKATKPFVVETPAQTAIFQKSLSGVAKAPEITKFKGLLDITRATEKTPSRFVQKTFIKETKALSPKGVSEVLKFAKKEKAEVYGSFAARQQMPKDLARVSADIDIQLKTGAEASALKTANLVSRLKKIGEPVRVSKKTPTLIEVKVGKEWHHAVDFRAGNG